MPTSRNWIIAIESVLTLGVLLQVTHAQSLPPDILKCTREHDSGKRLECFDKQVARYRDRAATSGDASHSPSSSANVANVTAAANLAEPHPVSQPLPPSSASHSEPVDANESPGQPSNRNTAEPPKHVAAKVVSVKGAPDSTVVSLDNGQIWEQAQEASADLNLHPGDSVTIDRQLGSYWLSGARGPAMKVRETQ